MCFREAITALPTVKCEMNTLSIVVRKVGSRRSQPQANPMHLKWGELVWTEGLGDIGSKFGRIFAEKRWKGARKAFNGKAKDVKVKESEKNKGEKTLKTKWQKKLQIETLEKNTRLFLPLGFEHSRLGMNLGWGDEG